MTFRTSLEKCLDVVREIRTGETKYVCYTRYSEVDQSLIIGVSDGEADWTVGLTERDLKERCIPSRDQASYISDLGQIIQDREISVSLSGDVVNLKCGGLGTFCLTRGGDGLQPLLFHLVDQLQSVRARLQVCERELESTRRQAAADKQLYTDATIGSQTTKKAISRPKRTAGSSLINPNRKKRKAATGVVFDSTSTTDT